MRNYYFLLLLLFLSIYSCKNNPLHINKIEGKRIEINNSYPPDTTIEAFIKPYREHVNNDLDGIISYAKDNYSKKDGELNTAIGNFLADMTYQQTAPLFKKRTGKDIDMVLLNHGGIRASIPKGPITSRTAFKVMPFENSLVVVALKGKYIHELTTYLSKAKRAHPISGLQLTLNSDYSINKVLINNNPINLNRTYYVVTNDYLLNGGDHMSFFAKNETHYILDYKIRNALIDYLKKTDTIAPVIDNRFIKL